MIFCKIKNKIKLFVSFPLSRKMQYIENSYFRLKTIFFYRYIFKKIDVRCIVRKPLFLTYEFISLGKGVIIWDSARIEAVHEYAGQSFEPSIIFEDGSSIQQRCHITAAGELIIGKNSIISYDVMITDIDHEYQNLELPVGDQPLSVNKTQIGSNCFIGSGVKIQAGTILGKHCVVGANSVVRGTFPDYCVIVGIPGRIVKRYNVKTKQWQRVDKTGTLLN